MLWVCATLGQNQHAVVARATLHSRQFPQHLIRLMAQQGGDARQAPIDVAAEYKCCAIEAAIDARVGDRASIDPLVHASGVCQGALHSSRCPIRCLCLASPALYERRRRRRQPLCTVCLGILHLLPLAKYLAQEGLLRDCIA